MISDSYSLIVRYKNLFGFHPSDCACQILHCTSLLFGDVA